MGDKCSLGLFTKTKDKRDLLANISHGYDKKYNVPFTEEDAKQKCIIFDIPNLRIDFITGSSITTGDHYYPLQADLKKKHIIGGDSEWNIIPVSGSNKKENKYNHLKPISLDDNYDISKLEEDEILVINKIRNWIKYVSSREAKLFHKVSEKARQRAKKRDDDMVKIQEEALKDMLLIPPED